MINIQQGVEDFHTLELPFTADEVERYLITYLQNKRIVFDTRTLKTAFEENTITVCLTGEQTTKLMAKYPVYIQLKVWFKDGRKPLVSTIEVAKVLEDITREYPYGRH